MAFFTSLPAILWRSLKGLQYPPSGGMPAYKLFVFPAFAYHSHCTLSKAGSDQPKVISQPLALNQSQIYKLGAKATHLQSFELTQS